MAAWVGTWRGGLALRLLGLSLCTLAWRMIAHLMLIGGHGRAGLPGYILATALFLSASLGSALALLGGHVFDEVRVSPRWSRA